MKRILILVAALAVFASPARALTDSELLDTIQHASFLYFWNEANPSNGLIRDRSQPGSPCSIAANGFGFSAITIGIDHGWITRAEGRARTLTTLQTFWNGPQGPADTGTMGFKGLYYHFLDMSTGLRVWSSELSTIDTALLFGGILDAKQYFTTNDPDEMQIRALADSIYFRADWEFMRNLGPGIRMGWKPVGGFSGFGTWIGYNEAMILYILALGSPTHPVPASTWTTWTSGYSFQTLFGQSYVVFPPLFGHQYSHCWVDFRNAKDAYMTNKGLTYFENSRRATLAQRAYCIANPGGFPSYGPNLWGLTASDGPNNTYTARGAPPAQNDEGTITPTAPASSIVFAPEVVLPTLHNLYENYPLLWGPYGFRDAFDIGDNWYDTDYLGIDQGPIVIMIENYMTVGKVWDRFMLNDPVRVGMTRAGFTGLVDVATPVLPAAKPGIELERIDPNPFHDQALVHYRLGTEAPVRITLHDLQGRLVADLVNRVEAPGEHGVTLAGRNLANGVYYLRLSSGGAPPVVRACVKLR
jgi:hypothetical protein